MIGVDIELNNRFETMKQTELKRIFSLKEIEYAQQYKYSAQHFCGFFCVKEALVKALDDKTLEFKKISVLHNPSGKPYIELNTYVKSLIKQYNINTIQVSISHTKEYSTAMVTID